MTLLVVPFSQALAVLNNVYHNAFHNTANTEGTNFSILYICGFDYIYLWLDELRAE